MYFKLILVSFFLIGSSFSIKKNQSTSDVRNSKLKLDLIEGSGHDKDLESSGSGLNPSGIDDEDTHISGDKNKVKSETVNKNNIETDDEDDSDFNQGSGDFVFKKDDEHEKSVAKSTEPTKIEEFSPKIITEKPIHVSNKDIDLETEQNIKHFDDIANNNDLSSYQPKNNDNDHDHGGDNESDKDNVNNNHINNNNKNGVFIMNTSDDRTTFFAQPGILAAIIGGTVVGLLCAILVVMFIVYRMRKKDEGSYSLNNEPKRSPVLNYAKGTNREFFA